MRAVSTIVLICTVMVVSFQTFGAVEKNEKYLKIQALFDAANLPVSQLDIQDMIRAIETANDKSGGSCVVISGHQGAVFESRKLVIQRILEAWPGPILESLVSEEREYPITDYVYKNFSVPNVAPGNIWRIKSENSLTTVISLLIVFPPFADGGKPRIVGSHVSEVTFKKDASYLYFQEISSGHGVRRPGDTGNRIGYCWKW